MGGGCLALRRPIWHIRMPGWPLPVPREGALGDTYAAGVLYRREESVQSQMWPGHTASTLRLRVRDSTVCGFREEEHGRGSDSRTEAHCEERKTGKGEYKTAESN